jgi:hypothetical protein
MVSDNRPQFEFRACPDLGDESGGDRLMRQRITVETCESRQDHNYHKCHSCVHQRLGVGRERTEAIASRWVSILRTR